MTILQNRRTAFSLTNTDVMSSAAPSSEAGIEKSDGQEGFFIYTSKAFDLWLKDANGAWSLYDSYGLADIADGVAFSWNTNTAAFIRTQEASHQISVFVIQTKTVGSFGNQEQTSVSSAGLDRLKEHSNYKRVRMQNSGHTGEAYAIAIFDANGEASYISAPVSGQREGKALGWDENGALGWITLTSAAVSVTSPTQYWDGSSASSQVGSNTLSQVTIDNTDGKYEDGFFNFGTSGTKNPPIVATQVSLSTGIYTFSLWFKNKRGGSDFGSIIRQDGVGSNSANYAMGTHQTTNELGLHKGGATNTSPGYGFFSSGYDMSSFEGDNSWNHLAVVADGTNSTFYVNGQQAGNVVANVVTSHFKQLGGLDSNNTQIFAEGIDEVGYWDSALTAAQIATIYNSSDKLSVLAPLPMYTPYGDATLSNDVYSLDGNGDYLVFNRDHRFTDQFTISGWFRAESDMQDNAVIFSNHDAGQAANGNVMSMGTNGKIRVKTADSGTGTTGDALNLGSNLNDGQWHHIAVTWEASTTNGRKIYLDGQLIHQNNSGVANAYRTSAQSNFYIGAMWNYITNQLHPTSWFSGDVKGIAIENAIMTAQEIEDDYDAGAPPTPEFTLFGDTTETDGVYSLDGNGDYLTYNRDFRYTDQYSISVWFKSNGNPSGLMPICSSHDAGGGGTGPNGNVFFLQTNGKLRIKTQDSGTGTTGDALDVSSNLGDNSWHQLVVTWEASTTNGRKIYIDGSLVHQNNSGASNTWNSSAQSLQYVGGMWNQNTNSFYALSWNGELANFSLVNSILTSSEVSDSYVADAPAVSVTSPSQYWDGSSTSTQLGSNTIALGGATLSTADGKYGSDSFNFGTSGNKQPILVGNDISLSTGIYTFSLWFKNKRSGSDWGSVLRQTAGASPAGTANYPILIRNTDNALGIFKREGGVNTFHSTGYTMTSFEGDSNWNHLVVVADGTNSTFYINGSQVGSSIAKVTTTSVGEIGSHGSTGNQVFAEGLDEVAYWDSALTSDQVEAIYNSSTKLSDLV